MTVSIELPDKHIQIIRYLLKGLTNKEIAAKMSMTVKNVERIKGALFIQFGCKNSAELVSWAYENKLV